MRSFNFRLFAVLVICTVVLAAGVHALHEHQVGRQTTLYVKLADDAEQRGEPLVAADYLRRYLQLERSDAKVLERYGLLLADNGRPREAVAPLLQAVNQDGTCVAARQRLVEVFLALKRFGEAKAQIEPHIRNQEEVSVDSAEVRIEQAQLRQQLATCNAGNNQWEPAKANCVEAIEIDPTQIDAYELLARLLIDRTTPPDPGGALDRLNVMVTANAEDFRSYLARGGFLRGRMNHPAIQELIYESLPEDAVEPVPDEFKEDQRRALVLLAAYRDARKAVEKAPECSAPSSDNGKSPPAADKDEEQRRGERYSALLFAAECANALARLAAVLPESTNFREEARALASEAIELDPRLPAPYGILAEGEIRSSDPSDTGAASERAREILLAGLQQAPSDPTLLWMLASLEVSAHRIDEARGLTARLKRTEGTAPLVRYLEARVLIDQQKWADAARTLDITRASLAEWPDLQKEADLWLGVCYGKLGRTAQQLRAFGSASKIDSFWVPALVGQADALLSAGRFAEGLEIYEKAAAQPQAPIGVQIVYYRLLILAGLRTSPGAAGWSVIRDRLDELRARNEVTRHQLRDIDVLIAETLAAQGDLAGAEAHLAAAIATDPDGVALWVTLAHVQLRQQQWDKAETTLQAARERLGDSADLRVGQAQYLAGRYREDPDGRERIIADVMALSQPPVGWPDDEVLRLGEGLYSPLIQVGARERAEAVLREIVGRDQTNVRARLALFDFALLSRDESGMQGILEEVRGIGGEGPDWHYGNAVLLVLKAELAAQGENSSELTKQQKARLRDALNELAEARKGRAGWYKIPLLQGRILDRLGMRDEAAAAYQEAFGSGAREPQAIVRLIRLQLERGDLSGATHVLEMMRGENRVPLSAHMAAAAADLSARLGSNDQAQGLAVLAEDIAKEVISHDTGRVEDHLVYGEILRLNGKLAEAEAELVKARGLSPGELAPWLLLVRLYAQTNRADDVSRLLAEADASFGAERGSLAVAQAYQLLHDLPRAEAQYAQALAASPRSAPVLRSAADFYLRQGKADAAQPLLAQLVDGTADGADSGDLRWGRRNLSLLLGAGTRRQWEEALQLIEQNLSGEDSSVEDRRMKAVILSVRPTQELRGQAIKLLEGIISESPAPLAEDRLTLAKLQLDEARWLLRRRAQQGSRQTGETGARARFDQAIRGLQQIIAEDPHHLRAICAYVRALVSDGQLTAARAFLPRLTSQAPTNAECLSTALAVLESDERLDEAYQLIDTCVPAELTAESASATGAAADLFSGLGARLAKTDQEIAVRFQERAESLYRQLAELHPGYSLALAGHYGRLGRTDEAVALIEGHLAGADPMELVAVCVVTLQGAGKDRGRLRGPMDAALVAAQAENPDSIPLRLMRADLRAWTNDSAEAERMYREVLELSPKHVMAANNLAFLLAWQKRDLEEALRWIETAIAEQGEQPELLDTRACVRMQLNQFAPAVEDLERALDEADDVAFGYHLSRALLRDRPAEALKAWERALSTGLELERLHPIEWEEFVKFRPQIESLKQDTTHAL